MNAFYCDGSGYNGQVSKYAVVDHEAGKTYIKTFRRNFTNNVMEYVAVLYAMRICEDGDVVFTDSKLVVEQCNRDEAKRWKVNHPHLLKLQTHVLKWLEHKPNVELRWVGRRENVAGIILDNKK